MNNTLASFCVSVILTACLFFSIKVHAGESAPVDTNERGQPSVSQSLVRPSAATEDCSPLQISFLGPPMQLVSEENAVCGLRIHLFAGRNKDVRGIDIGGLNQADNMTGVQLGLFMNRVDDFNKERRRLLGESYVNSSGRPSMSGVQISFWNQTMGHMKGVQIGFVNVSQYLTGVQIGLVNVVYGLDKALPFFPFINIGWY